jgi:CRP-like cAMP-binding protein
MKSTATGNLLLDSLPETLRAKLVDHGERVDLEFGQVLCEPAQDLTHAWFPMTCFVSLLAPLPGHEAIELGMIGNEGMLGASMVLGSRLPFMRGVVQGAGQALRVPAAELQRFASSNAVLRDLMGRSVHRIVDQLVQSATCNSFHELQPRLARWLLMSQDHAHSDTLQLTHQFLANMLGVQRSAVTIAAGSLQAQGLIEYSRGRVSVVSRSGLVAAACGCYEEPTHA